MREKLEFIEKLLQVRGAIRSKKPRSELFNALNKVLIA